MPNYLIIYTNGETSNSCTFEHSENVSPFTAMLRGLEYRYEVYVYMDNRGYIRSTIYPAQI